MKKFTDEHKEKIRQAHLARNADVTNQICEMAKEGKSTKEIASFFKRTPQGINKILRKRGIKTVRGPNPKKGRSTNPEKVAEVCEMAKQGKTAQEIAYYYNAKGYRHSAGRIYEILNREGIIIPRLPNGMANPEKIEEICEMFRKGMSVTAISKHFDHSGTAYVCRVLTERGLRTYKPKRTDGYTEDQWGYLWVRIPDDDPMVCMRTKRGTVLEHRLVKAREIGRPLTKDETVHHINGDRKDNRQENLQLHAGKHGKGQKLECVDCKSNNILTDGYNRYGDCGSPKTCFVEI